MYLDPYAPVPIQTRHEIGDTMVKLNLKENVHTNLRNSIYIVCQSKFQVSEFEKPMQ